MDTEGVAELDRKTFSNRPVFRKPHFDSSIQTLGGWATAGISKTNVTFSVNGREP